MERQGLEPEEKRYRRGILRAVAWCGIVGTAPSVGAHLLTWLRAPSRPVLVMLATATELTVACVVGLVLVRWGRLRAATKLLLSALLLSLTVFSLCLEERQLSNGALGLALVILLALALEPSRAAAAWSATALASYAVGLASLVFGSYPRLVLSQGWDLSLVTGLLLALLLVALLGRSISRHLRHTLAHSEAARLQAERAHAWLQEQRAEIQRAEAGLAHLAFGLDDSNRELRDFARVISEGLRRPLQALGRDCQALKAQGAARLDETGREHLQGMTESARHMDALVAGLLAYSSLERSEQGSEPVDLGALLERVATVLQLRSRAQLTLPAKAPTVRANRMRLEQVFSNLLDNAVKFQRPGVRPEIAVECAEREDAWQLAVRDNGIGIESRHFEKIFEVFSRLHAPGEYDGTGIGLAIVRKVIEEHGGEVWVESTPGQGSAFRFTLPKPDRAARARASGEVPRPAAGSGSLPALVRTLAESEGSEEQRQQQRRVLSLVCRYILVVVPPFLATLGYVFVRQPSSVVLISLGSAALLEAVSGWSLWRLRRGELLRPARALLGVLLLVMTSHMLFQEDAVLVNGVTVFALVLLMATSIERTSLALRWFWGVVVLLALALALRNILPSVPYGLGALTPWVLRPMPVSALFLFALFANANMGLLREALARSQAARARLDGVNAQLEERKEQLLTTQARLSALTANLTRSNRDLQSFAYIASHDLRAPLRALVNYSRFLEEDCGPQLDEAGLRYLRGIAQSAREMDALVADLLEYSRIGRVPVQPEWLDLGRLLQDVVSALRLPAGSITWPAELPAVWARRARLEQILSRLIEMIEPRLAQGQVRAVIECDDRGEGWELSVRGGGPAQDASEARIGRTAIGLAIARKAVQEHGGTLWWDSSPEDGRVARFTLPKPAPAAA